MGDRDRDRDRGASVRWIGVRGVPGVVLSIRRRLELSIVDVFSPSRQTYVFNMSSDNEGEISKVGRRRR